MQDALTNESPDVSDVTAAPVDDGLAHDATVVASVVIPCLNEAETVEECVRAALSAMERAGIRGEVIVADNGSHDGSAEIASRAGAHVVHEPRRGYGSAYLAGFSAASGQFIVMADGDLTYDFDEIPRFLAELEAGADMVVGDRMRNIHAGAMPWHHRYIGNPLLSGLLNLLFHTGVNDAHCGMRALRRNSLDALELRTTGMEFASEMVVRAAKAKLVVGQLAIEYRPRGGESKLSSFRDGWRHTRFLLLHSPRHLFIVPGTIVMAAGAVLSLTVLAHLSIFGRGWNLHTLIGGSMLLILGVQIVGLGLCAEAFTAYSMGYAEPWFERASERLRLEHGLLLGAFVALSGFALCVTVLVDWISHGLGSLSQERLAISGATLVVLGAQVLFCSFLLSLLGLRRP
jgi:glycosyltransferase involved in cell wall biosynthesis